MLRSAFVVLFSSSLLILASCQVESSSQPVVNEGPFQSVSDALTNYTVNPLSTFGQILNAAGLQQALSDPSLNATILAPSNFAWTKFFNTTNVPMTTLLSNQTLLQQILQYHVIPGVVFTTQNATAAVTAADGQLPTLLQSETIEVATKNRSLSSDESSSTSSGTSGGSTEQETAGGSSATMGAASVPTPESDTTSSPSGFSDISFKGSGTEGVSGSVDAEIVFPDVVVGQSVIHVIDAVLIPETLEQNLLSLVQGGNNQPTDPQQVQAASGGGGGRKLMGNLLFVH